MKYSDSVNIAHLPSANISRSVFDRSRPLYTTCSASDLIPVFWDEILPGDSFEVKESVVARLQTLLEPIYSQVYLDTFWFYVPNRLLWTHWREFQGENTSGYWIQPTNYTEPKLNMGTRTNYQDKFPAKSLGDYFGLPTGVTIGTDVVSSLPFRAYCLCYNEFFRSEDLQDPVLVNLGDTNSQVQSSVVANPSASDILNYTQFGVLPPLKANKYHDYFTSCLPSPQKGPDVSLPLAGIAPVVAFRDSFSDAQLYGGYASTGASRTQLNPILMKTFTGSSATTSSAINASQNVGVNASGQVSRENGTTAMGTSTNHPIFSNLGVNLSDNVQATINDLRLSFATQRYYEALARSGSRYTEQLQALWGVESPDARLQRPEYLGGSHTVLNVDQILNQNGDSTSAGPLGKTGAYSLTYDQNETVRKSFVEHGVLLCLACVRYEHDYQQGIPKMWTRKTKFDYYLPQFSALGEMPVLSRNIYADGSSSDDQVFGYQEAWAEYRYPITGANVTGEMRSNYTTPLDMWHLADDYASRPSLSGSWLQEDPSTLDRVLAVQSGTADQVLLNFWFDVKATRPIPVYSIPGGLDMR